MAIKYVANVYAYFIFIGISVQRITYKSSSLSATHFGSSSQPILSPGPKNFENEPLDITLPT